MVVSRKYDVIDLEKGTLDNSIYTDDEIYQDELEKIFGRSWLMIGHVSLIPNPNDFFLSYIGEDPVIITRDGKGELHVFLNMCRHRGNRVVRADDGNAKNFMCTYHGWTFSNEGKLVSVPGLQEAYYGELDVENLSLVEARCEIYAGLIFGCWDQEAPNLEAFLGDARWYLDTIFNRVDAGMQAHGPDKWSQPVNWKTPVDNSPDWYHVTVTHVGTTLAQTRHQGSKLAPLANLKNLLSMQGQHVFVNGHSMVINLKDEESPRIAHGITDKNFPMFLEYWNSVKEEEIRRLGAFRALRLQVMTHTVFPNTVLFFRIALPRGPHRTEFWHFGTFERDIPDEAMRILVRGSQNNGTAGVFEQDDIDNWRQVTDSGSTPMRRKFRHQLSMGIGHAGAHPHYKGSVSEQFITEHDQRNYYARWQEFMNANSWKDIHIEPISADYEGTATILG